MAARTSSKQSPRCGQVSAATSPKAAASYRPSTAPCWPGAARSTSSAGVAIGPGDTPSRFSATIPLSGVHQLFEALPGMAAQMPANQLLGADDELLLQQARPCSGVAVATRGDSAPCHR